MATIQENRKNGKLVSYKFTACVGRDAAGKQIRYYRTWTPPREYAPARARKCAQLEAAQWEQAIRKHGTNSAQVLGSAAARRAEKTDFCAFITDTWLPIQVCNGSKKPKTEDFYKSMTKLICKYFNGWFLQDIRPIDVQKHLIYLRTEYTGKSGKPLTAKTLSHQYSTLHLIFSYAEQQELISKNPMHKVDAPKKETRPVDALTQVQALRFFQCLRDCPLDFQCMLHLLITTGIRRGECLGLKWKDIDARAATLNIARNVTYTVKSGTIVSSPKTAAGIRTVPLLGATLSLLQSYRNQQRSAYPGINLDEAFLFSSSTDLFRPRDPNAVTRKVKRFMCRSGLPDMSPHDLRHPYVKHTTKIFSLRLMDFQAQAYPDARRKTRGACQLLRVGQSRSPVRPLYNRKRFSCLPPQSKMSWILYAISMRLSGYTSTRSISISASSVVSASASKIALDASFRLSCRACSSCFCFACANTAA